MQRPPRKSNRQINVKHKSFARRAPGQHSVGPSRRQRRGAFSGRRSSQRTHSRPQSTIDPVGGPPRSPRPNQHFPRTAPQRRQRQGVHLPREQVRSESHHVGRTPQPRDDPRARSRGARDSKQPSAQATFITPQRRQRPGVHLLREQSSRRRAITWATSSSRQLKPSSSRPSAGRIKASTFSESSHHVGESSRGQDAAAERRSSSVSGQLLGPTAPRPAPGITCQISRRARRRAAISSGHLHQRHLEGQVQLPRVTGQIRCNRNNRWARAIRGHSIQVTQDTKDL